MNLGCQDKGISIKNKTGKAPFNGCELVSTSQKIVFRPCSYLMYNIDVFLCQSDKEKHVRIGEIFISPILKLLSRIR